MGTGLAASLPRASVRLTATRHHGKLRCLMGPRPCLLAPLSGALGAWPELFRRDRAAHGAGRCGRRRAGAAASIWPIPPERPDPALYSQDQELALGQIPSWDSPDILTNNDVPWSLHPETEVTVRNLSPKVAAVNTQVQLALSPFGIGLAKTPMANQLVTLGPSATTTLKFPLTQAILQGDQSIGVFVQLYHPNDAVAINSRGAQVITGIDTVAAGRHVTRHFPVANPTGAAQTISLAVLPNTVAAVVTPASHAFAPTSRSPPASPSPCRGACTIRWNSPR